jgi:hypothetical protein
MGNTENMAKFLPGRPEPDEHAPYVAKYAALVAEDDIFAALKDQSSGIAPVAAALTDEQALHRYAPDKWSIKEILEHVADTERVLAYRALRIARGDRTPLASFEHDDYVKIAGSDRRALKSLLDNLSAVRAATVALFESLTPEDWTRRGIASNHEISVRALAYFVAGHDRHHASILKRKYLAKSSEL